jgi:GT2 family glycosyltransferase
MNIACIFLTLNRPELSLQTIKHNFFNAEKDADVYLVDNGSTPENFNLISRSYPFKNFYRFDENKGIAHAINKGIEFGKDYDGIVTLANDILMPKGWLRLMSSYAVNIPNTGMAGIHCVEQLPEISIINGLAVHLSYEKTFGNTLITKAAIDKIGRFNEDLDPYSNQDADYAYRLMKTGFINYYIPGVRSEHIGHDVGNGTEYRKMKDESLERNWKKHHEWLKYYDDTGNYYL